MKIIFLGSGHIGLPSLIAIAESEKHELVGVFTQPSRKAGRSRKVTPTPVSEWAAANKIDCVEAEDINSDEMLEKIAGCGADLMVVIAFGQFISQKAISIQPKRAINVHASLLPKYRGAGPVNRAVINGDKKSGVSIITVENKMDAGDVLGTAEVDIAPDDTAGSLHDTLAVLAPEVLLKAIDQIADGSVVYEKQDESKVTLAPKLKKSDGHIDLSEPAEILCNKIRGFWPWPGAQIDFVCGGTKKCVRVTFAMAEVVRSDESSGRYGILDDDLNIICGKDKLKILRLKPAGSELMDFKDFVNGRALKPGDLFLPIEKND